MPLLRLLHPASHRSSSILATAIVGRQLSGCLLCLLALLAVSSAVFVARLTAVLGPPTRFSAAAPPARFECDRHGLPRGSPRRDDASMAAPRHTRGSADGDAFWGGVVASDIPTVFIASHRRSGTHLLMDFGLRKRGN